MKHIACLTCFLVLAAAVPSSAQVTLPDPWLEASTADGVPMSLFCLPGGGGAPFAEAYAFGGVQADATIDMTLYETFGTTAPLASFPAEDIWLGGTHGQLAVCWGGGVVPDADTDALGHTRWTLPAPAGGRVNPDEGDQLLIYVVGSAMPGSEGVSNLRINSADIDGDGFVNLSDAGLFVLDLVGYYNYRSDFVWDGVINLSDAGRMAAALGDACP